MNVQEAIEPLNASRPLAMHGRRANPVSFAVDTAKKEVMISESHRGGIISLPFDDIVYVKKTSEGFELAALTFNLEQHKGRSACLCYPSAVPSRGQDRKLMKFVIKSDACIDFVRNLNALIFGTAQVLPRKTLVIINPHAGTGSAVKDWERVVHPLMSESERFDFKVKHTERKMHACEFGKAFAQEIQSAASDTLNFVVLCGGDGLVFEFLNGIYLNHPSEYLCILKRTVLCPLPCGSGNGLSFSTLCEANEPFTLNCALRLLLRQKTAQKDLGLIEFQENEFDRPMGSSRIFSLTLSWGLVAEVDIKSEFLRTVFGDSRFTIYGFFKVLQKQLFPATLVWDNNQQEIQPDYVTVFATLVPVAARTVVLDPSKSMADGHVWIHRIVGSDMGRLGLVNALEELSLRRNHNKHITGFDPIKTSSFELVPDLSLSHAKSSAGIVLDGEQLTNGPVRVRVLPCATHVLSSGH